MFWEWAFTILMSIGAITGIGNMCQASNLADKIFWTAMATAEFMAAVMLIMRIMIMLLGI